MVQLNTAVVTTPRQQGRNNGSKERNTRFMAKRAFAFLAFAFHTSSFLFCFFSVLLAGSQIIQRMKISFLNRLQ